MTKMAFSEKGWEKYWGKKISHTWVLIPMFENGEDWVKNIQTLSIELYGTKEIVSHDPELESRLITAISKLKGLASNDDFVYHRKTVFEIISLIEELRDLGKE